MAFSNILSHQFVQSFEIFFAQILPEFLVVSRNKIIIHQSASCDLHGHLSVRLAIELLNLLDFVLQLTRHLIDLCTLHILMIYLVSLRGASFALSLLHVFELEQLSFSEFDNYKFLKLDKIDHVEE